MPWSWRSASVLVISLPWLAAPAEGGSVPAHDSLAAPRSTRSAREPRLLLRSVSDDGPGELNPNDTGATKIDALDLSGARDDVTDATLKKALATHKDIQSL